MKQIDVKDLIPRKQIQPKIIFEDEDLIVLDKPWGMTVNKSKTTKDEQTVQDWIEEHEVSKGNDRYRKYRTEKRVPSDTFLSRAGIVHRLDKETSGILLVAKNESSFLNLQSQFKNRTVKKTYTALVHGSIDVEEGEISVPVGRLPWNRKQFGVVAGGREATTKYKVLSIMYYVSEGKREPLTLVQLYPKTGRTHQIRVHLKYFGHPIFSDFLYGGRKTARADRKILPRVFLHASKIEFNHPRFAKATQGEPKTGIVQNFESPLPKELAQFIINMEVK